MKITGFVLIKKDADLSKSILQHYNLPGAIFPVLEFGSTDGTLIYVKDSSINIRVPESIIEHKFACEVAADFILPANLTEFEKTSYIARISRCNVPYYTNEVKDRIICDSLIAGKLDDSILFKSNE